MGQLGELTIMTAVNCHRVTSGEDRVDCLLMFEWFMQHTSLKIESSFLPSINAPSPLNPVFKPDKTLLNSSTHYQQYSLWQIPLVQERLVIPYSGLQQVVVCPAEGAIITWSEEEIVQSETQVLLLRYLSLFLTNFMWCITQVMSENVSVQESTLMHVGW